MTGEPEPALGGRQSLPAARQGPGRIIEHQRARLHPRPSRSTSSAGPSEGARGWSYREVLPLFPPLGKLGRRRQRLSRRRRPGPGADPRVPGAALFGVPRSRPCRGHALSDDLNGALPEGFGAFQTNIDHGVRASTAHAYLRAAAGRPNLAIELGAQVNRVRLHGNRADGISYAQGGAERQVAATREVILAGGTFNSPQLLMLSGNRSRRRAAPPRYRRGDRSSRRRGEPAGPSVRLHEVRVHRAALDNALPAPGPDGARGAAMVRAPSRACGRQQSRDHGAAAQRPVRAAAGHRDPAPGRDLRSC